MLRQIADHDTTEFKQTMQTERHTLEKQLLQDVSNVKYLLVTSISISAQVIEKLFYKTLCAYILHVFVHNTSCMITGHKCFGK